MLATPTHLLLDFFGTVVEYSPSRTTQGYERTHDLTTRMGSSLTYEQSRATWSAAFDRLDEETSAGLEEFSSRQVAQLALEMILEREPDDREIQASDQSYTADWSAGICYPSGTLDVLRQLGDRFTLAVVSNTHDVDLVQTHLRAMGADHFFTTVITSIDVGRRKPHPAIYQAALDALDISPADALFVGDTYLADYVGPERLGIRSFLIDPDSHAQVPSSRRIDSLLNLPDRLKDQSFI